MLARSLLATTTLAAAAIAGTGCGGGSDPELNVPEWHDVAWPGGTARVSVIRPPNEGDGAPHPVLFTLPWGSGSESLVLDFQASYWSSEPALRGYYVVTPSVLGTTLEDTAEDLIPAIFAWMDAELDYDASRVALIGASNGGLGIFYAALAEPDRFRTLLGMPGQWQGPAEALDLLAGKRVWLIVGERDTSWREGAESTIAALESRGVETRFDIAPGQSHVIALQMPQVMDEIDLMLGR
jgi:predicted esterase